MIPWLPWERRWRDALVAAMIPSISGRPGLDRIELDRFWPRFFAAAPPLLRLGVRAATWILTWAAPALIGRWRRFHKLTAADRDRLLESASQHRRYFVRQLALSIKLAACFAYLESPAIRDGIDPERWPAWRLA